MSRAVERWKPDDMTEPSQDPDSLPSPWIVEQEQQESSSSNRKCDTEDEDEYQIEKMRRVRDHIEALNSDDFQRLKTNMFFIFGAPPIE